MWLNGGITNSGVPTTCSENNALSDSHHCEKVLKRALLNRLTPFLAIVHAEATLLSESMQHFVHVSTTLNALEVGL